MQATDRMRPTAKESFQPNSKCAYVDIRRRMQLIYEKEPRCDNGKTNHSSHADAAQHSKINGLAWTGHVNLFRNQLKSFHCTHDQWVFTSATASLHPIRRVNLK
ncbi:unnamed protein product [Ixodes pacificus]